MFGFIYTNFILICRLIQSAIEKGSSEGYREVAKKNGKTVYFDYYGNERLVSNNHRAASGVKDWETGDVGVKDLETFKLVENWSDSKNSENEIKKKELEKKVSKYNEAIKQDYKQRVANEYCGKPIWFPGKKVIFIKERNEYGIGYRDYDLENNREVKGCGQDCYYDVHEIFMLKSSIKSLEEIMKENEKIINRSWKPSWTDYKTNKLGELKTIDLCHFKSRKELIEYADSINAPYRKEK